MGHTMKTASLERSAACLKAMSHPLRLSILAILADGEKNVQELTRQLGTSQSNVSQHLAQMRARDLVAARREGNQVHYSVRNPKVLKLVVLMREVFCGEG
jgi:ArsR family transcriptional regulator